MEEGGSPAWPQACNLMKRILCSFRWKSSSRECSSGQVYGSYVLHVHLGVGAHGGDVFGIIAGQSWTIWGGIGGQKEGELPGAARVYALCILQEARVR